MRSGRQCALCRTGHLFHLPRPRRTACGPRRTLWARSAQFACHPQDSAVACQHPSLLQPEAHAVAQGPPGPGPARPPAWPGSRVDRDSPQHQVSGGARLVDIPFTAALSVFCFHAPFPAERCCCCCCCCCCCHAHRSSVGCTRRAPARAPASRSSPHVFLIAHRPMPRLIDPPQAAHGAHQQGQRQAADAAGARVP